MKIKTNIQAGAILAMTIIVSSAYADFDADMYQLQQQYNQRQMIDAQQQENFLIQQQMQRQQAQQQQNDFNNRARGIDPNILFQVRPPCLGRFCQ